jgi:hypothetical protein
MEDEISGEAHLHLCAPLHERQLSLLIPEAKRPRKGPFLGAVGVSVGEFLVG